MACSMAVVMIAAKSSRIVEILSSEDLVYIVLELMALSEQRDIMFVSRPHVVGAPRTIFH